MEGSTIVLVEDSDGSEDCDVVGVWRPPASAIVVAPSRAKRRRVATLAGLRGALGVVPRAAHYYVQRGPPTAVRAAGGGSRCAQCQQRLLAQELCLGYMPAVGSTTPAGGRWVHALTPQCLAGAGLPPVPASCISFEPALRQGGRWRGQVLTALRFSWPVASEEALRRIVPWEYAPAVLQCWADGGAVLPAPLEDLPVPEDDDMAASPRAMGVASGATATEAWEAALEPARPLEEGEAKGEPCAVCHERLSKGRRPVRRLPCSHRFHDDCIMPWLRRRPVCPLDRRELPGAGTAKRADEGAPLPS